MAWQSNEDGSRTCDICAVTFRSPHACSCPRRLPMVTAPGDIPLGVFQRLTEQAHAEGLPDRLTAERNLVKRIKRADSAVKVYRRQSNELATAGMLDHAIKLLALSEQAANRGDKLVRAQIALIGDRERRTDLERREELARVATGKPPPAKAERASA